jgi:hypothetical protein
MKSALTIIMLWFFVNTIWSQTFTESAFFASKSVTDTSENMSMLQDCDYTYDRLLKATPKDSSILFYAVLNQTKMAYLTLESDPMNALKYISNSQAQLTLIDTAFRFGNEIKVIKLFQKIITLKASKSVEYKLSDFEKEVELFYVATKQSARANLVYAFYLYHFDRTKKQKMIEGLLRTSVILFDKEKTLNLPINWGKNLAVNLSAKIKSNFKKNGAQNKVYSK